MSKNSSDGIRDRIGSYLKRECQGNEKIGIKETRKSCIFMTPHHVYKLKKQLRDDLQDLTSLSSRHSNCLTEIDLNRRLAPDIYLDLIPVVKGAKENISLGGAGAILDWLIKMQRMPESRMFDQMIQEHAKNRKVLQPFVELLARQLSSFYRSCPVSNLRDHELVTILEDQHRIDRSVLLDPRFSELHSRFLITLDAYVEALSDISPLFAERVAKGWVRECHGDLRPEHICLTDPPVIFDCLEFNRNLRLHDPYRELIHLGLETDILGAPWIKGELVRIIASDLGSKPKDELLQFYEVIHALLRTRICLAHLLVSKPRTPKKWLPLGLRYFNVAEGLLGVCSG